MAITVLDSSNLQAVLNDAQGLEVEPKVDLRSETNKAPEPEAVERDAKPDVDPDDVEGDDGLTPRDKRDLSSKMLKAVGKKHRQVREAEELAAAQYSERKLAEGETATLRRELDELRAKAQPETRQPNAPEKPTRYNFSSEESYIDALVDWTADQKITARDEIQAMQVEQLRQVEIQQTARQRIAKAIELVPDFAEVTDIDDDVPPLIASYMQRSPLIAEMGYYFAKNPDVLISLKKLPNDEQLVQLGEIKSKLTPFGAKPKAQSATNANTASDETGLPPSKARVAAPVIKPISSAGTISQDPDAHDMSYLEARSAYQKANKVNFGIRRRH